jgi:hypothetical protein
MNMKEENNQMQKTCFVIMPFGGCFDDYYKEIYKPAIESTGLKSIRADDLSRSSPIIQDIWQFTLAADLILADLTQKNSNVFYELGLAHALAKPAILISNSMDDVPFDLRALRVIIYDKNNSAWGDKLEKDIEKAIKETLSSPINWILPTFLKQSDSKNQSITISESDFLELRRELSLLKSEVRNSYIGRTTFLTERAIQKIMETFSPRQGESFDSILDRLLSYGLPKEFAIEQAKYYTNNSSDKQEK